MIRVQVAPIFIERQLRTGAKTHALTEIIQGLPANAQLFNAGVDPVTHNLVLLFSQPDVANTEVTDLDIHVRSEPAISLEQLEATKQKTHLNTSLLVERVIE